MLSCPICPLPLRGQFQLVSIPNHLVDVNFMVLEKFMH
jgi:hypothetical protein